MPHPVWLARLLKRSPAPYRWDAGRLDFIPVRTYPGEGPAAHPGPSDHVVLGSPDPMVLRGSPQEGPVTYPGPGRSDHVVIGVPDPLVYLPDREDPSPTPDRPAALHVEERDMPSATPLTQANPIQRNSRAGWHDELVSAHLDLSQVAGRLEGLVERLVGSPSNPSRDLDHGPGSPMPETGLLAQVADKARAIKGVNGRISEALDRLEEMLPT